MLTQLEICTPEHGIARSLLTLTFDLLTSNLLSQLHTCMQGHMFPEKFIVSTTFRFRLNRRQWTDRRTDRWTTGSNAMRPFGEGGA